MISVIIPAFNEARTVAGVVTAAKTSPLVEEVIVVDDGSTDETSLRAKEAGAIVLRFAKNSGKGAAIDHGIQQAAHDVVLFLDGDLVGVTPELIERLGAPVISGEVGMTVALRELMFRNLPPVLSGTRALRKELWRQVPEVEKQGYRVEIALNYFGRKFGPVRFVKVKGLHHVIKETKYGLTQGAAKRVAMMYDLAAAGMSLYLFHNSYFERRSRERRVAHVGIGADQGRNK